MSRRPRPLVWFQWFGLAEKAICPVCGEREMIRDSKRSGDGAWQREHIIRLAIGGPDTYPNLIPICKGCNLAMGKEISCTFDYMVQIGRMSPEQAKSEIFRHRQRCTNFDPRCKATLSTSGRQCANLKAGKNEMYCCKHIRSQIEPMDCSEN